MSETKQKFISIMPNPARNGFFLSPKFWRVSRRSRKARVRYHTEVQPQTIEKNSSFVVTPFHPTLLMIVHAFPIFSRTSRVTRNNKLYTSHEWHIRGCHCSSRGSFECDRKIPGAKWRRLAECTDHHYRR